MVTVLKSFNKNPNIGLYGFTTNKFVLIGTEIREQEAKELEEIFKVPVHRINIAGTSLIGVFIVGNEDLILVPSTTFNSELEELDRLGIKYEVFKSDLTCLGNNIFMTKEGAIVNPDFTNQEVKKIGELFKVPVEKMTIADIEIPGSCIVTNKELALIHRDASSAETNKVESLLKIKTSPSTINMGVPFVKSGILCNENGMIIGEISGPAEIMNAEENLGYLD